MLLTHSSLSHYSSGSVLLHTLPGRLGVDPAGGETEKQTLCDGPGQSSAEMWI